jgi:hypothetical protein
MMIRTDLDDEKRRRRNSCNVGEDERNSSLGEKKC